MIASVIRRSAAVVLFCAFVVPMASAATFTVTNGGDSGPGTLRQAILDANANSGRDQIILATDVTLQSSLPDITGPIDISGSRTPMGRYRIDAEFFSDGFRALTFAVGADGSTVRSIIVGGVVTAIAIRASNVTATHIEAREAVVVVEGNDNVIGGSAATEPNSIFRLRVFGDRNIVIGTRASNVAILGAENTQLGTAATGNVFGGVRVQQSPGTIVRNNALSEISVSQPFVSEQPGPTIVDNTVTHNSPGAAIYLATLTSAVVRNNTIRAQTTGVAIASDATGIEITGNSIVAGGLAIDLGNDGSTSNDPAPDADTGANERQNFPVLTSALLTPGSLTVTGTLTSAPLTPYQIELFSNDAANPDARTFLRSLNVTTDATGNVTFTHTITTALPGADEVITATATNRGTVPTPGNTPNSTSEVSAPLAVTQPGVVGLSATTYTVDEGAGTVTITVQRTDGSEGTVTVDYATANGTATAPADYTAASGTLTFRPGVTTQSFTIPIVEDTIAEAAETFTVTLTGPTGGAALGTTTATITINDNEPAVAAAPVPTASEWALITMALALALIGVLRR